MFLGHAVSNSVLDILVLLLPVPFMTALRIAGKSRAGLIGLFIMGSRYVVHSRWIGANRTMLTANQCSSSGNRPHHCSFSQPRWYGACD